MAAILGNAKDRATDVRGFLGGVRTGAFAQDAPSKGRGQTKARADSQGRPRELELHAFADWHLRHRKPVDNHGIAATKITPASNASM
jgi:hypothetical protein